MTRQTAKGAPSASTPLQSRARAQDIRRSEGAGNACYLLGVVLAGLLGALLYLPHLTVPLYRLDDLRQAREALGQGFGLRDVFCLDYAGFFRPGARLLWIASAKLFTFDPVPYRLLCFILHGLVSAVLVVAARQATGSRAVGVAAGVTYAVSYPHFGGVTWVSAAFTELPSALLCLTSLSLYLAGRSRGGAVLLTLSLAAFLLAIAFKESAVGWLLPMALLDRYRFGAGSARRLWPWGAAALAGCLVQAGLDVSGATEGTWRARRHSPGLGHLPHLFVALREVFLRPLLDGSVLEWPSEAWRVFALALGALLSTAAAAALWRAGAVARLGVQCLLASLALPALVGVRFTASRALVVPSLFLALALAGLLQWAWSRRRRTLALAAYLAFLCLNALWVWNRLADYRPRPPEERRGATVLATVLSSAARPALGGRPGAPVGEAAD